MLALNENMQPISICNNNIVEVDPVITKDSRFIACACGNNINLYSTSNGERCRIFKGHNSKVMCIHQVSDELIMSCSLNGSVVVWSCKDFSIQKSWQLPDKLHYAHLITLSAGDDDEGKENTGNIYCIGYGIIKLKENGKKYKLLRFEIKKNNDEPIIETIVEKFTSNSNSFAFGVKNTILATASSKRLQILVLETKEKFIHLSFTKISSIAIHPTEKLIATGMLDGKIVLWRDFGTTAPPLTAEYHWHCLPVKALHFKADGSTLYSGGYECALVSWSSVNMKKSILPRLSSPISSIVTSSDGSLVAACSVHNGIHLVDSSSKVVQIVQGSTHLCKEVELTGTKRLHLDPRTGLLFYVGLPGQLQFYDPFKDAHVFNLDITKQSYTAPDSLSHPIPTTNITHASVSDDGDWLVTAQTLTYPGDSRIETALKFWKRQAGTFELHSKYEMEKTEVTSLSARNCTREGFPITFATTLSDGSFCTWEFVPDDGTGIGSSWKCSFVEEYRNPTYCDFSYDGSILGLVHTKCVSLWDALEGKRIRVVSHYREEVYKFLVFGQKFDSNIFYVTTDKSLACWSPNREDRWIIPLCVSTMIGNPGSEDVIVFTTDFKVQLYMPQRSCPVKSIDLTDSKVVVSACVLRSRLVFVTDDREMYALVASDCELDPEDDDHSRNIDGHFMSRLTTDGAEVEKKSRSFDVIKTRHPVMFSNVWGIKFLETITPKWNAIKNIEIRCADD